MLEEDGTAVESEDFLQLLEDDTCLMVLECGQSWSPSRVRTPDGGSYRPQALDSLPSCFSSLALIQGQTHGER